jgi:hypothetical protein
MKAEIEQTVGDITGENSGQAVEPIMVRENTPRNSFHAGEPGNVNEGDPVIGAIGDVSGTIPCGPALPPGKNMQFTTNFLMVTRLKIVNENPKPATISVNGIGKFIPAAEGSFPGSLDLSRAWNFGKPVIIQNQCDWVLRIEY